MKSIMVSVAMMMLYCSRLRVTIAPVAVSATSAPESAPQVRLVSTCTVFAVSGHACRPRGADRSNDRLCCESFCMSPPARHRQELSVPTDSGALAQFTDPGPLGTMGTSTNANAIAFDCARLGTLDSSRENGDPSKPNFPSLQAAEALLRTLAGKLLGGAWSAAVRVVNSSDEAMHAIPVPPSMNGAGPRRRATFLAGRSSAHAALKMMGSGTVDVPSLPSGAPRWPPGFSGSISHTNDVAAAIVAPDPPIMGLGLDIEDDLPLDDHGMVRIVCRTDELGDMFDVNDQRALWRAKLLFVIKESVYKLHHPLGGAYLDFQDVRVALDLDASRFRAELVDTTMQGVAGPVIDGGFVREGGMLAALAVHYR